MRLKRVTMVLAALALAAPATASASSIWSPADDFALKDWIPIHVLGLDLSITKAVAYLMLGTVVTCALGILLMRVRLSQVPGRRQSFGEVIYDIAQTQVAEMGLPSKAIARWFPYVATLMLFIFVLNLISFLPLPLTGETWHHIPVFGIYAATSTLSVTLMLALMTWIFTHIEGIRYNGVVGYFKSWIPEVPKAMLVPIAIIEVFSQFMRLISLSVRLFANMLAGHMLILTMAGLVFILQTSPWRYLGLLGLPVALIFYVFEVVIVVTIQAFIFAALSAIYIGTAIEPQH